VSVNRYLVQDLLERGLWSDAMKKQLIAHNGSVQYIAEVPAELRELYKTTWEIKQKSILEMAADRAPYICQSQSLNIHMTDCTPAKLSSMHFYGWKLGLKTGQYYLRTKAAVDAIKFTVDVASQQAAATKMSDVDKAKAANATEQGETEVCVNCSG
jgi:ribonucleotide reductase alpha subunit